MHDRALTIIVREAHHQVPTIILDNSSTRYFSLSSGHIHIQFMFSPTRPIPIAPSAPLESYVFWLNPDNPYNILLKLAGCFLGASISESNSTWEMNFMHMRCALICVPSNVAAHLATYIPHKLKEAIPARQRSNWERDPILGIHISIACFIEEKHEGRRNIYPKQRHISLATSDCKNKWDKSLRTHFCSNVIGMQSEYLSPWFGYLLEFLAA